MTLQPYTMKVLYQDLISYHYPSGTSCSCWSDLFKNKPNAYVVYVMSCNVMICSTSVLVCFVSDDNFEAF